MALEHYKTQVLLLHSQQSTLDSLSTGFSDRYSVHCATSGTEALNTLTETPIHVIVSAQDLPGMSGLDAIREAKKRSPDTIGILLATGNQQDGLEALVGDKEVFQIVRGEIAPEALRDLIDNATKQVRLIALSESANDHAANVDEPAGEHIVMETSANGSTIISDGTGTMPALKPQKVQISPTAGGRSVDVLVLTKDEEFLATIKDSSRGLHNVHHATTPTQAEEFVRGNTVGVLVTDAAMVGSNIEILTQRLRGEVPRMVAVVAGRRDDGEMLMDLINRGQVYRFLLKPVSPGRARLAIEASVKHHLEAPDSTFKTAAPARKAPPKKPVQKTTSAPQAKARPKPAKKPVAKKRVAKKPVAKQKQGTSDTGIRRTPTISATPAPVNAELDDAFGDDASFTETMTDIAIKVGKSFSNVKDSIAGGQKEQPPAPASDPIGMDIGDSGGFGSILANPKVLAAVGVAVVSGLLGIWMFSGSDDTPTTTTPAAVASRPTPATDDQVPPPQSNEPAAEVVQTSFADLLEEARFARDAGQLVAPPGNSALELYVAAVAASPDDAVAAAEFADVLNDVFGMAELALLDQRVVDAEIALNAVRSASPSNPRLSFLDAQLSQMKFRDSIDQARAAIRERRFEDAGRLLSQAQAVRDGDFAELDLVSQELASARSEQRVDEVVALAGQRLEEGRLTSPSNDNARYYYELAISNNPGNTAAQQGLIIVASKLVLDARAAIDEGNLELAGSLLTEARELDPSSDELRASSRALEGAREEQLRSASQAEAERQAALDAQAEAERQAAIDAQAEAERQAAAERQAVADREAAARQAEEERRVAAAAAAAAALAATDNGNATAQPTQSSSTPAAQTADPEVSPATSSPADDVPPEAAVAAVATAAGADLAGADAMAANTAPPTQSQASPVEPVQQQVQAPPVPSGPENVGISSLNRVHYVAPKYPRSAMRRELNGSVDLKFTVALDGSVYNVDVVDSTPGTVFDQAAVDAVSKWRFEPVIESGIAVEKRTGVRMAFALE